MNKILKTFLCLSAFVSTLVFPARAMGAEEEAVVSAKSGAIRGRVVDEAEHTLPGASIWIPSLEEGTVSDVEGFYTLANLLPGTYVLQVTYVGYASREISVSVEAGKTTGLDIVLHEGVELKEVSVVGAFKGQRRALNAQKNAMGVVDVVSSDQIGKFPDANIGDALKRISGINVQYDQGEARFGQVRGTSADLSSVTINGNRLPSAEGDIRNVQLDLIPSDMIQTIEVNKVVTSDMDADAIGGSINLVTKGSPYRRTFSATVGSGYNMVSDKAQLNLGLSYGDRFFKDKFGIMVAASYQNAPIGSDDVEFEYDRDEESGEVFLTDAETRQYYVTRQRQSYSLSLDYDINENNKLTFKGIYNRRHDWENRYRISFKDLDSPEDMSAEVETKGGSPAERNARLELQQTMDLSLGGEHLIAKRLDFDWGASWSRASEDRPHERYFNLKQEGLNFDIVNPGTRFPYISNPAHLREGEWEVDQLTESDQNIYENDIKGHIDFSLDLVKGRFSNKLKFGAKHVTKTKHKEITVYDYAGAFEELYGSSWSAALVEQIREGYMPDGYYPSTDFVSNAYLGSLRLSDMEGEQVLEESSGNFDAEEHVSSAYVRFDQNFGPRHQLVVGLRMEATNLAYQGYNWNIDAEEEESLVPTGRERHRYFNWLPSVLYRFDISDRLQFRASFTETLARPRYSALVPSTHINLHDMELNLGNPDLTPSLSYNFDASIDYFFESVGLVSAGIFYKRINDFIVDQRISGEYEYAPGVFADFDQIVQPVNAGDADLLGVEVTLQRDLGFITPALKCLGIYGNYTYTYSNVQNFNFEGRENEQGLRLPGSPAHTANASLYFELKGFHLRLSYNYASSFIDEMGEHAELDRYYDAVNYLDLNASYTFGKDFKWTIYAEATNLLNQPLRYYQGRKERTMQVEFYGMRFNAGLKLNF